MDRRADRVGRLMDDFLRTALSFPTVVFTTALGVVLVYWVVVVLGAIDIDVFGVDVDLELEGDVGAEGLDGDLDAEGASGLASLLAALRLKHAPLTVTLSVIILVSEAGCNRVSAF